MIKDIYINIAPFRVGILSNENIKQISERMNLYIDDIKQIIDRYPNLILMIIMNILHFI